MLDTKTTEDKPRRDHLWGNSYKINWEKARIIDLKAQEVKRKFKKLSMYCPKHKLCI